MKPLQVAYDTGRHLHYSKLVDASVLATDI